MLFEGEIHLETRDPSTRVSRLGELRLRPRLTTDFTLSDLGVLQGTIE